MKAIKLITFLLSIIVLISCSKPSSSFVFDKVEHYKDSENKSLYETVYQKRFENLTILEKRYIAIIETEVPEKISDTSFIADLERLHFKKSIIKTNRFDELREIFNPKACSEHKKSACTPIYRDIYIFKNKSKVVAIGKVCFECQIVYFIDSTSKWERFGECTEYENLKLIK